METEIKYRIKRERGEWEGGRKEKPNDIASQNFLKIFVKIRFAGMLIIRQYTADFGE